MPFTRVWDSFARPANTTQYGANDLVANSATAGSVVPLRFGIPGGGKKGQVLRVGLFKDDETTTAASFNVHFFSASPTVTNGDNGAYAVSSVEYFLGTVAIDMSSGATASTTDLIEWATVSGGIVFSTEHEGIYALIEALGAYTPASAEVFKVILDVEV